MTGLTKEEKIAKIYEVIADKTLSFWCRLLIRTSPDGYAWTERGKYMLLREENDELAYLHSVLSLDDPAEVEIYDNCRMYGTEVVWHQVMLWDVLDRVESNKKDGGLVDHWDWTGHWLDQELVPMRIHKRKPIDEQPEQVIDYVYSLIQDQWQN